MIKNNSLFLDTLAGKTTLRPPLWIMRQAGRYLPEYRAVRERVDFLTLCRTPELACEVTLQPIRRFGLDASIVFSDIMMPLEAMGVTLAFAPGPIIESPIRTPADVARLRIPADAEVAPYVAEAIKLLVQELPVPLIGFAGAPLTLAAYLVEGRGSKDFSQLRAFFWSEPTAAMSLMEKLADMTIGYLRAQIAAGASAIQLFDSWAGLVDENTYRRFALPAVCRVMRALEDLKVPRIYFANNACHLWDAVREVPAEGFGVDWRQDLRAVRERFGPKIALQGNLDPAALFASPTQVEILAEKVLRQGSGGPHIMNLGHGILPKTPIASVEALVKTVQNFKPHV